MKIAEYALTMQASHSRSQQTSVRESLRVEVDRPATRPAPPADLQVTISAAGQQRQAADAAAIDGASSDVQNDPRMQLLILMIEKMTGHKVRLFDAGQLHAAQPAQAPAAQPSQTGTAPAGSQPAAPPRAGFSADYSRVETYSESEQTTMQASGVIKTSDGKEIQFSLNLAMQYQYSETSTTTVHVGDAPRKTDPLVINFNGTAAQLSSQRFAFDLNSDGNNEQINVPLSGSGFLALDLNGDGRINNGGELFGPGTGNGFAELAKYDGDHNGWIDANDAVFQQLKVWTKDAAGNDKMSSLASIGMGALSLQAIATPFDLKTATNQLLGAIRSTSVAIAENGTVGTVQQVDLTV